LLHLALVAREACRPAPIPFGSPPPSKETATMAHIAEMPASLNTAILFGLIGSGLMACVVSALMYDAGRLFSAS